MLDFARRCNESILLKETLYCGLPAVFFSIFALYIRTDQDRYGQ